MCNNLLYLTANHKSNHYFTSLGNLKKLCDFPHNQFSITLPTSGRLYIKQISKVSSFMEHLIMIIKQKNSNSNTAGLVLATGLKITAGQRTMSGLIEGLTGQTFDLPVMLTGQN